MQSLLGIFLSFWISMKLYECHPTFQSTTTKPIEWSTGQAELAYPQFHTVTKSKSVNPGRISIVVLRTSQETFYIELKPNKDLLKSNVSDKLGRNHTKNCHYHGNVLSHPGGVAAISACEQHRNRMMGTIMVDRDTFIVHPLDLLEDEVELLHLQNSTGSWGIVPHVIRKVENPLAQYCGVGHGETLFHPIEDEIDNHLRRRRSNPGDGNATMVHYKVIETSVFVDYSLYHKFVVERKKSKTELIDVVLAIMNQVQILYNKESLKIKFKIVVVKLEILMQEKDAPNPADGDIDVYLDNFCNWQSTINPPEGKANHWDHSIMLSGYDLHKVINNKKNPKVLGLAWVNGMCRPKHSCTINEGSSFEAAFVIAHEMGHSLGMFHDGSGNNCSSTGYLMAQKTGPGIMTWSKCSNDYLERFFRKGRGKCLEDGNTNLGAHSYKFDNLLPGNLFDLTEQCRLSLGKEYIPHTVDKVPFNNVCRELWCVSGFWAKVAHPALEGSSCGRGGKCIEGKCKGEEQEPHSIPNGYLSIQKMVIDFLERLEMAFQFMLPKSFK